MRIICAASAVLCFGVLCLIPRTKSDDVLVFTDSDFNEKIKQYSALLVKFISPSCGHCKALAPEFEKAANILRFNNPPVALAEVDCISTGQTTCNRFGIKGYPSLKVFSDGELLYTYDGPRDADGIVGYMKVKLSSGSQELKTLEQFDSCLEDIDNVVIGFFENQESEISKTFRRLADMQKQHYRFAYTYSNRLMTKYGYRNDVVLFRSKKLQTKQEPSQVKFEGKPTLYEMRTWLTSAYHGLVGYRTHSNREQFEAPFVVVYCNVEFTGKPTDTRYWRNRVMVVAKTYAKGKRRVTFALSDAHEFRQELLDFDLDPMAAKPLVAARDASQRRFAMRTDFSMEALEQFVEDLLDDSLKPFVKSDLLPSRTDGLVKVVVRTNFEEIVNDPTKDVFLELHAPWCQVCKHVAEKLEEVAEKLKNETNIVFARMDVTTNDLPRPYYIKGYPSLYFALKNSKPDPKLYQGGLTVRDFLQFLAAEASLPLEGYDRHGNKLAKPYEKPDKTEL